MRRPRRPTQPRPPAVLQSAVLRMEIAELVTRSELIVQGITGNVVKTGEATLPGTNLQIPYSDVEIEVTEALMAIVDPPDAIRIRTLGGDSLMVTEEATFAFGEEVLVFACKDTGNLFDLDQETFTVQGLFQGKYTIVRTTPTPLAIRAEGEPVELQALIAEIGGASGLTAGPAGLTI